MEEMEGMLGTIRMNKQDAVTTMRIFDTLFYPAGQLKEDAFRDQHLRTEVDKAVFHFPPVVCQVMVIVRSCDCMLCGCCQIM